MAKANFRAQSINPFDIFDMTPVREPGWHKGRKPSDKMMAALVKFGVPDAEVNRLSFTQAKQLIGTMIERREHGQCSFKQAKLLRKHGYIDTRCHSPKHRPSSTDLQKTDGAGQRWPSEISRQPPPAYSPRWQTKAARHHAAHTEQRPFPVGQLRLLCRK